MKEIEVLVEVYEDLSKMKKILSKFNYQGTKKIIDEYYYDPKRKTLKPDKNNKIFHCLRTRQKNNEYLVTYKDDIYKRGKWIYSNEYETKVESLDTMKEIFEKIGLVKFIEINNEKETYTTDKYEIVLENVKDLGIFLEVEYCTTDDVDVIEIKKEIQKFIDSLNIKVSEELNMGKPEMYLKKYNIKL